MKINSIDTWIMREHMKDHLILSIGKRYSFLEANPLGVIVAGKKQEDVGLYSDKGFNQMTQRIDHTFHYEGDHPKDFAKIELSSRGMHHTIKLSNFLGPLKLNNPVIK